MKSYHELSADEQTKARAHFLTSLLTDIIEGGLRFNDELNQDGLQARIDAAFDKADAMQTPWFSHEYILDTCRNELESMALCMAEDTTYLQPDEQMPVRLVA